MNRMLAVLCLALAAVSGSAQATIGVTVGHRVMADDGMPDLAPGEQASVFYCVGRMTGPEALDCSLRKCMKAFGIEGSRDKKQIARHCIADGWSERPGYSVMVVGPAGDNQYIASKALGDATREIAMKYVRSNNFPVDKGRIVIDLYDDAGVPENGVRYRGAADSEDAHRSMTR